MMSKAFLVILLLLLILHPCFFPPGFADATLDPTDFTALLAIRKGLKDLPGSNFFSSWNFAFDPCHFAGVNCTGDGDKVLGLTLGEGTAGSPGLTGRIDPAIGNLSALSMLTLFPGRIFGALPDSLSQLKGLSFLAITGNFISGNIPASLGQLRNLKTLDLSYNQLTGSIPPEIGEIPALQSVFLSRNHLSGPLPVFISKSLNRVDLNHNNLSGSLPSNAFAPSLERLSLSSNQLTGPVGPTLIGLTRLTFLDLSSNQFTGDIPGAVFYFPVTDLLLQRNQFSGMVSPAAGQVNITTIDLSHNRLYGNISPTLSTVLNLYMNSNRFTGVVPDEFVPRLHSGKIRILYLQHNFLTGIHVDPIQNPVAENSTLCLVYNCMVPPVLSTCPASAGQQKSRPTNQCKDWETKGR